MKYFFTFLLFSLFGSGHSQNIISAKVVEIKNNSVIKVLTSIESLVFEKGKKLEFSLFKINNGSGSAHVSGDDEISESYLIGVTESFGDEVPSIKYFFVGPFYNPKIVSKIDLDHIYKIVVQHGGYKMRQKHTISISLNKVTYE